jgi:hypothetical protein
MDEFHRLNRKLTRIEALLIEVLFTGEQIMSAISDFAAKVSAFNDQIDTAIAGLQGDVKNLTDQIAALQASTGTITAADQALLDGIQTRAQGIADKLTALDALTPPVAPPVTPASGGGPGPGNTGP